MQSIIVYCLLGNGEKFVIRSFDDGHFVQAMVWMLRNQSASLPLGIEILATN